MTKRRRYDIRFDLAEYYGGLTAATVWRYSQAANGSLPVWDTGDNWYLVGIRAEDLNGLLVRI